MLPDARGLYQDVYKRQTYIRTLCKDIGEFLGCGAAMKTLVRTRVSEFFLEQALTLRCV